MGSHVVQALRLYIVVVRGDWQGDAVLVKSLFLESLQI
jgi:hypothetical protein